MFEDFIADVGIQTADIWCRKQLLCQLRHNHGPISGHSFPEIAIDASQTEQVGWAYFGVGTTLLIALLRWSSMRVLSGESKSQSPVREALV